MEWHRHGVTLLPLGTLFAAARLSGHLIQAVTAGAKPEDIDTVLKEVLQDGPIICDRYRSRYYALVPASMPRTWHEAAEDWRTDGVDVFGRGTLLGVPRLDADKARPDSESYWSVPMDSPAVLCSPLHLARLIAAGHQQLLVQAAEPAGAASVASVTGLRHDARQ